VNALGAQRVAIDGLNSLEAALPDPARLYNFLSALVLELRRAGATTLFTKQIAKIHGPSVDFSDTPLAATSENLLSLRTVEVDGSGAPCALDPEDDRQRSRFVGARVPHQLRGRARPRSRFDTAPRVLAVLDGEERLPVH